MEFPLKVWNRAFLLLVFYVLAVNGDECPDKFEHNGEFCYRFFEEQKSWHDAEAYCNQFTNTDGAIGHLASIHSDEENDYVSTIVNLGVGWSADDRGVYTYIGLRKPAGKIWRDGDFDWTDGTPYDYGHWATGEPNGGIIEHCVLTNFESRGNWDDQGCGGAAFVCKVPFPSSATVDTTFWTSYRDSMYRFYCDKTTWDEASTICESDSAHLVIINDSDENDFVSTLTASSTKKAGPPTRIGLKEKTPVSFEWSDGTNYEGDYDKLCCVHTNDGKKRGNWNNGDCTSKLAFVCERNE